MNANSAALKLSEMADNDLVGIILQETPNARLWNRAWTHLVNRNSRRLVGVFMQKYNSQQEAEDLVQEAFQKAVKSIKNFKLDCQFSSWLYRIANNLWIDRLRKAKIKFISIDSNNSDNGKGVDLPSDEENPLAHITLVEELELLNKALLELKPKERELIELRQQNFTFREIAEMMNENDVTLRTRHLLIVRRLRNIMLQLSEPEKKTSKLRAFLSKFKLANKQ